MSVTVERTEWSIWKSRVEIKKRKQFHVLKRVSRAEVALRTHWRMITKIKLAVVCFMTTSLTKK